MKKPILAGLFLLLISLTATASKNQPLVSPDWLSENLEREDLVVLDIRNKIDGGSREVFEQGHIPGAVYSSYTDDGWRVTENGVVGKLPPVKDLEALIGSLGIDNEDHVVIVPAGVSSTDFGSAARVYWTFKVLGHDQVSILNGGYKAWSGAGKPVAEGWNAPEAASFQADFRPELIATTEEAATAMDGGAQLIDARPAKQYAGDAKHPKARAAGTIPGSVNLQQQTLVRANSADFVSRDELEQLLADADVSADGRAVTFCNTGHWASTAWFALSEIAGRENVAMYDGSMVEWSQDESRPLAVEKSGLQKLLSIFD